MLDGPRSTENPTFEFPYLPTIGLERCFEGRLAIRSVLALVGAQIPSFSISNIAIHDIIGTLRTTPKGRSREPIESTYRTTPVCLSPATARSKRLREYLDVIASARVLLPNGFADVPNAY